MINTLNLTQRQMCEKVSHQMDINNIKTSGFQAFLAHILLIKDDATMTISFDDMVAYKVIDDEMHLSSITWTSDPIINQNFLESHTMYIHHENDQYVNDREWSNIMSSFPTGTLASNIGQPIMNIVREKGFLTLASYSRSLFNYMTESVSFDVVIYVGTERIRLCTVNIDNERNVTITNISDEIATVIQSLAVVVAGTAMVHDLCAALSNGLHSPADLMAVLNHYASSNCSSIATFAKKVLQAGRNSINDTITLIVQLFRDSGIDYSEDSDGNIRWEITSHPVTSNFWMVAGNIIVGSAQAIGTILLFSGWVIGKIIGGLLVVGSSIFQAITQTIGTISGTTPYICEEAIDLCYHDPVAQQDGLVLLLNKTDSNLLSVLKDYGKAKILVDSCTVYLYNFKIISDTEFKVDVKVFANMSTICPAMHIARYTEDLGWGIDPRYYMANNGQAHGGLISFFHEDDIVANDKGWYFSYDSNNGIDFESVPGTEPEKHRNKSISKTNIFNQFVMNQQYAEKVSNLPLSARSADSNDWKTLWDVLRANVLTTLAYAFCNPLFYSSTGDTKMMVNSFNSRNYSLDGIVYYAMYEGGTGYVTMVNDIIKLSNYNHSNDMFIASLLNTFGLYGERITLTLTERVIYFESDDDTMFDIKGRNINVITQSSETTYHYDDVGIFPFLAIDNYSYVTPPTCDFKSIIWGAIIAAGIVAAVTAAIVVTKAVISKKVSQYMERKGQALMSEGDTFRKGFTPEEYKQLPPEDQKTWTREWKKYNLKVKIYNAVANCLGLSTLDWKNNWYDSSTGALIVPPAQDNLQPDLINTVIDSVTSSGVLAKYNEDPSYFDESPSDTLVLYRLISGRNPS